MFAAFLAVLSSTGLLTVEEQEIKVSVAAASKERESARFIILCLATFAGRDGDGTAFMQQKTHEVASSAPSASANCLLT
jgi:hypothetical protein